MKNFISLLIFLLFACLGMWWYYSCDWCSVKKNSSITTVQNQPDPAEEARKKKAYEDSIALANKLANGFFIKDHLGKDIFRYPEQLQILKTNDSVCIPSSADGYNDLLANYLGKNLDKELIVYGFETKEEQDSGKQLGLDRANFVKNLFITGGINADRILTKSKLHDYTYNDEGKYNGGITFEIHEVSNKDRLNEIEKSIANKTLYSNFGQKDFKPDATLSSYAIELKNYLVKYPEKKVNIIGHTDDIGEEEDNLWFGKQRANNVKKYLVSRGIPSEKLTTQSKGESDPIVPNDSPENRNKNRRIEIIVN
ncbi:OmpA family protein [Aquimarina hainanensis]|uniref:OmpA family protein n=1 Tax=Aquimarina hainanensis TaxID=1578017 RepID=A0ABW5NF12_9FLAO